MKRLAFVIPWYGENISGGAEAELRGLAHHLQDAGVDLEILSTCVKDFRSDWSVNYHKPGVENCAGISVRRFPVRKRDTVRFDEVNAKFMSGAAVSAEEEKLFMREMVNSPELYKYIREHKADYELFIFIPYMFGTTYYGARECLEKAILIPCLHDEAYAHMQLFKETFSKVAGMTFLSDPERLLAGSLYNVHGESFPFLGAGVDTGFSPDALRFRQTYGLEEPFILYAGRKDAGKRVDVLIRYFIEFKKRNPSDLKLVLIGGGDIEIPSGDIIDLGFVSDQDKYDAYAAAAVFCNPSELESFSIVIMESWLAEVPVLVNGECEVTKDFAKKANGGLYYTSFVEFEGCLNYLLSHPATAKLMGKNGRSFVLENFAWDAIIAKYRCYFEIMGRRCNGQETAAQTCVSEKDASIFDERPLGLSFPDSGNAQDLVAVLLLFADFQRESTKECRLRIIPHDENSRALALVLCRELMISDLVDVCDLDDRTEYRDDICLIACDCEAVSEDGISSDDKEAGDYKVVIDRFDHDKNMKSLKQVVDMLGTEEE